MPIFAPSMLSKLVCLVQIVAVISINTVHNNGNKRQGSTHAESSDLPKVDVDEKKLEEKQQEREQSGKIMLKTPDEEREKAFYETIKAGSDSFVHLLKLSGPPGHIAGFGVAWLKYGLDRLRNENKNLWNMLNDKVEIKIGQKLADFYLEKVDNEVIAPLEEAMAYNTFGLNELRMTVRKKFIVFPQRHKSLGFNYKLVMPILYWIPFMIAAYHRYLPQTDGTRDCALANELNEVRERVVVACKELARKRLREIHGEQDESGRDVNVCDCEVLPCDCLGLHKLTYRDGLSDKTVKIVIQEEISFAFMFDDDIQPIVKDIENFLWTELVEKVNLFLNPEICMVKRGCKCPKQIRRDEITVDWPKSCYGDTDEVICSHPCGEFGTGDYYCYEGGSTKKKTCDKINWDTCMPVKDPKIPKLNNVTPFKKDT